MTCGGFLELRSMGWEIKRNEPNRASEHQKRFIAMGLDGLAGWYMDGRAVKLSLCPFHSFKHLKILKNSKVIRVRP